MLAAFLNQNGHANFRIALGGIADEPGVVGKLRAFFDEIHFVVADDLSRAGLAAQLDASESELATGAARLVHDAVHGVSYFLDGGFGYGESFIAHILSIFQHVRLFEIATRSDSANQAGQLQRSCGDRTLASSYRNYFTGIPLAMKSPLDPFLRRHKTWFLGRKIDTGSV